MNQWLKMLFFHTKSPPSFECVKSVTRTPLIKISINKLSRVRKEKARIEDYCKRLANFATMYMFNHNSAVWEMYNKANIRSKKLAFHSTFWYTDLNQQFLMFDYVFPQSKFELSAVKIKVKPKTKSRCVNTVKDTKHVILALPSQNCQPPLAFVIMQDPLNEE